MKPSEYKKYILQTIRVINLVILCLALIMIYSFIFTDESEFTVHSQVVIISLVISPLLAIYIIEKIRNKYEFLEWDKEERRKKTAFLNIVTMIVFFFTYGSIFTLIGSIIELYKSHYNISVDIVFGILLGIYLLLNAMYTVKLHHKIYSEYLVRDFTVEKPDNWEKKAEPSNLDCIHAYLNSRD